MQYYGWALANRDALLPTREQLEAATGDGRGGARAAQGRLVIDYVVPDYYARRPKACMGGWGRRFLNVTPSGKSAALPRGGDPAGLDFPSVRDSSLADDLARRSEAFNRFRGTDGCREPCRSCERREIDWGGCRCQAFALTGDAGRTDPACALSPDHHMLDVARRQAQAPDPALVYRRIGGLLDARHDSDSDGR